MSNEHQFSPSALPRLPFGNAIAKCDTSVQTLCDTIKHAMSGTWDMQASGDGPFQQKSSFAHIGAISLATATSTPLWIRRDAQPYATLRIPTYGHCFYQAGNRQMVEVPGRTAVLLSGRPREAEMKEIACSVHAPIDAQRLTATVSAMLGRAPATLPALALDEDREVPLHFADISFDDILRKYFALVESLESHPEVLALLGVDDALYRCFAMMLQPALFFDSAKNAAPAHCDPLLDTVCDYIQARIDQPITLTELEQLSGLSARGLQYAFMHRFQCTPMEWVRHERLSRARNKLLSATPGNTVISVALACGFSNPGIFARYYRQNFGELPSDTLDRALNP